MLEIYVFFLIFYNYLIITLLWISSKIKIIFIHVIKRNKVM